MLGRYSVCSFEGVSCYNTFILDLALTSGGLSVLLCSSVVPSATAYRTIVLGK